MKLAELQAYFGRALFHGHDAAFMSLLHDEGVPPERLLGIYRDSMFASLTSVIGDTFAAVRRLLGDESFRRTAEGFVCALPPTQPCLDEYGEHFAEFLEGSTVAHGRPYLPDLARLEWLVHRAAHAPVWIPLSASTLRRAARAAPTRVTLRLDPSIAWVKSRFPVDVIWSARLCESAIDDLECDRPNLCIEVRWCRGRVVLQRLDEAAHAFRAALGSGASLAAAGAAAKMLKPDFPVLAGLAELLRFDAVVSLTLRRSGGKPS
jgi:hypothetical protein